MDKLITAPTYRQSEEVFNMHQAVIDEAEFLDDKVYEFIENIIGTKDKDNGKEKG